MESIRWRDKPTRQALMFLLAFLLFDVGVRGCNLVGRTDTRRIPGKEGEEEEKKIEEYESNGGDGALLEDADEIVGHKSMLGDWTLGVLREGKVVYLQGGPETFEHLQTHSNDTVLEACDLPKVQSSKCELLWIKVSRLLNEKW
jgi:hypothetical protein